VALLMWFCWCDFADVVLRVWGRQNQIPCQERKIKWHFMSGEEDKIRFDLRRGR
jgi:hypothetical protein